MKHNWQQSDWPNFRYDLSGIQDILYFFAEKTGQISGVFKSLPESMQTETIIDLMVSEATKTSKIGGEYINREDVMSSIRNNFGLNKPPKKLHDQKAKGAANLMLDVRHTFSNQLSKKKLFEWHKMLMIGHTGMVLS